MPTALRLSLSALLLLASATLAQAQSSFEKRWQERVKSFERENARLDPALKPVVLFGSSSMEGWKYGKRIKRFFPTLAPRILNRGISGDGIGLKRNTGLFRRLEASVYGAKPSVVVLLNGRNSLGYGAERVAARYREVVLAIRKRLPKTTICLVTCAPVRGRYAHLKAKTAALNTSLRKLARELKFPLIDLHAKLVDSKGNMKSELTSDGLHFKDPGYKILGAEIEKVVAKAEAAPKTKPAPKGAAKQAGTLKQATKGLSGRLGG